jgi:hypothetical protein
MQHPDDLTHAEIKQEILQAVANGSLFVGRDAEAHDCGRSVQVIFPNGQRLVFLVIDSVSRWKEKA